MFPFFVVLHRSLGHHAMMLQHLADTGASRGEGDIQLARYGDEGLCQTAYVSQGFENFPHVYMPATNDWTNRMLVVLQQVLMRL